jgi:hypothetical protein
VTAETVDEDVEDRLCQAVDESVVDEVDERVPSQNPDTQVLKAHGESEVQVAPKFPQ